MDTQIKFLMRRQASLIFFSNIFIVFIIRRIDLAVIRWMIEEERIMTHEIWYDMRVVWCTGRVFVGERVTREGWREIIVNTSSQGNLGGRSQAETLLEDCTCGEQV